VFNISRAVWSDNKVVTITVKQKWSLLVVSVEVLRELYLAHYEQDILLNWCSEHEVIAKSRPVAHCSSLHMLQI